MNNVGIVTVGLNSCRPLHQSIVLRFQRILDALHTSFRVAVTGMTQHVRCDDDIDHFARLICCPSEYPSEFAPGAAGCDRRKSDAQFFCAATSNSSSGVANSLGYSDGRDQSRGNDDVVVASHVLCQSL